MRSNSHRNSWSWRLDNPRAVIHPRWPGRTAYNRRRRGWGCTNLWQPRRDHRPSSSWDCPFSPHPNGADTGQNIEWTRITCRLISPWLFSEPWWMWKDKLYAHRSLFFPVSDTQYDHASSVARARIPSIREYGRERLGDNPTEEKIIELNVKSDVNHAPNCRSLLRLSALKCTEFYRVADMENAYISTCGSFSLAATNLARGKLVSPLPHLTTCLPRPNTTSSYPPQKPTNPTPNHHELPFPPTTTMSSGHVPEPKNFEPKTPVHLNPPKNDPVSVQHLSKCDGKLPDLHCQSSWGSASYKRCVAYRYVGAVKQTTKADQWTALPPSTRHRPQPPNIRSHQRPNLRRQRQRGLRS